MLRRSLALAALLTSTSAMAGSISYDFRFDNKSTTWNDDAAALGNPTGATPTTATVASNNRFELKTGRVDFKGKLSDQLEYRLRWRFDRTQTVAGADAIGAHVDLASITHHAAENVGVTVGKYATEVGGWEGQAPGDYYVLSETYSGFGKTNLGIATGSPTLTNASALYLSGVRVDYGMGDHSLALQLGNNLYQSGA